MRSRSPAQIGAKGHHSRFPLFALLFETSSVGADKAKKRPPKPGQDRRRKPQVIEATCFEQITTAQVAAFISGQVASRVLAPKTANRYREILTRLFNWAMTQHGIKMPGDKNPAARVEPGVSLGSVVVALANAAIDWVCPFEGCMTARGSVLRGKDLVAPR
jgi:hypothetical protein